MLPKYELFNADCLETLKTLENNSIDSMVTDPPAGISFMGKEWDKSEGFIPFMTDIMREALRVLKPGAHALVWAIPRTSHWTATALENAGFEIRDVITHLFGSGFPKSLDISKAIDKAAGLERERIPGGQGGINTVLGSRKPGEAISAEAISAEASLWQGFGTALKPASEHWILARKPLSEKTVAKNVLKHGTGGINIDGCRVGQPPNAITRHKRSTEMDFIPNSQGRFPTNLVLEDDSILGEHSRFFYCAKASKSERNLGCEGLPEKEMRSAGGTTSSGKPSMEGHDRFGSIQRNIHPCVKPTKLMAYLIKLITPPHGIVLDPFMGSGSTGVAAIREGFSFIGIEKEPEYLEIAEKRITNQGDNECQPHSPRKGNRSHRPPRPLMPNK